MRVTFVGRPARRPGAVLALALLFAVAADSRAATPPEPAATPAPAPTPAPDAAHAVERRALREFDRFLDHHPLIEGELLLKPQLVSRAAYLGHNAELRDFLRANVDVRPGLAVYPRYFLHRALLRQASAPLKYSEVAKIDPLLEADPALERQLRDNPELIRDATFLRAHAAFHDYLVHQPELAAVFLNAASVATQEGVPK